MTETHFSPLGGATASDIRNIKKPGLVLPVRKRDEKLLVFPWDGEMFAMMLTGKHAFSYFSISLQSPHQGLFLPQVEVLVDFDSAVEGMGRSEDKGVLLLEQGKLSVIGEKAGHSFGDGHPVPLWMDVEGGSEGSQVAFERWAIGVRENDKHRILWSHEFKRQSD